MRGRFGVGRGNSRRDLGIFRRLLGSFRVARSRCADGASKLVARDRRGRGIGTVVAWKSLLWAVTVVALPGFIRITRASVLSRAPKKKYVQASRAFGAGAFRQMFLVILPNCLAPLIVQASLGFSDGILNMAALGIFGPPVGKRPRLSGA